MDAETLVVKYFKLGLSHREILHSVEHFNGHATSIQTIKRICQKWGLYRRKNKTDLMKVVEFIAGECAGYGQMHGYQWMHAKCLENSIVVSQDTLRIILHIIDPTGIEKRKASAVKTPRRACTGTTIKPVSP